MSTELLHIPLVKIRRNPSALRDVDKSSEQYQGMLDSVKLYGILTPINVKPYVDLETKEECYMLCDGLHRYTTACDAGLDSIPAQIKDTDDKTVKITQLIANIHKVETKPVEYSKQLHRILADDPMQTISKLAAILGKSPQWLSERLGLTKLKDDLAKLVDSGDINLSNGYALAKLPEEEQDNFKERAITMTPQEFVPVVQSRVKEISAAKRRGENAAPEEFVAKPHVRKIGILTAEIENPQAGPHLCKVSGLSKLDSKTAAAEAGFKLGLEYALNIDSVSIEEAKKAWTEKVVVGRQKREDAAKERDVKRAADAAVNANRLKLQADTRIAGGDVAAVLKKFDDENGLVNGKKPKVEAPAEAVAAA